MSLFDNLSPVAIGQTQRILSSVAAAAAVTAGTSMTGTQLDSANSGKKGKEEPEDKTTFDSATDAFADQYVATMAVSVVNQWVGTDDLEAGESLADRLVNTLVGIADEDADGELGEAETAVALESFTSAAAYMQNMGATAEDAQAIFGDDLEEATAAAERVRDLLASKLPDGAAEGDLLDSVVFGDEDQETALDAAFKRKVAIRGGKKVIINKRISGRAKLSSKQKLALKKARRKAFSAGAMLKRAKSMRIRQSMGMNR